MLKCHRAPIQGASMTLKGILSQRKSLTLTLRIPAWLGSHADTVLVNMIFVWVMLWPGVFSLVIYLLFFLISLYTSAVTIWLLITVIVSSSLKVAIANWILINWYCYSVHVTKTSQIRTTICRVAAERIPSQRRSVHADAICLSVDCRSYSLVSLIEFTLQAVMHTCGHNWQLTKYAGCSKTRAIQQSFWRDGYRVSLQCLILDCTFGGCFETDSLAK